jgi:L-threonylcarbamoyladenylate synthase
MIAVNPLEPGENAVSEAARVLLSGGIIAFPAETVYGLGVDAGNPEALKLLYSIKKRDIGKPTSILISSPEELGRLTSGISREAGRLIDEFWPGPLTIVFKASKNVSEILTAGTGTIGIRMPGSRLCLRLLERAGIPMTAPSANPEGKPPAVSAEEALEYFGRGLDLVLDGGKSTQPPTTMVDSTGSGISIIREGALGAKKIMSALS